MYGYQMIKKIQEQSNNLFEFQEGTLYPILHSLEEKGLITSYWDETGSKKRKYYSITKKGKEQLKEKTSEVNVCLTQGMFIIIDLIFLISIVQKYNSDCNEREEKMKVLIIIPAYNEELNIEKTVNKIKNIIIVQRIQQIT